MPDRALSVLPAHPGAFAVVGATAVFGALSCALGAYNWGAFGLVAGLVSAWGCFLLGLVALYRREQPDPAANVRVTDPLDGASAAVPARP